MTTRRSALAAAARALVPVEGEASRRVARRLLGHVLGLPPERLLTDDDGLLDPDAGRALDAALARRLAGEPISRITGRRAFWSLDLALGPDTLDPRPDTETVVAAALAAAPPRPLRILDLGTGSGCILLALLGERPDAFGIGIDRSEGAVGVARANAHALGLAGRAAFLVGDWATAIAGRYDLIVSNPPYIPTREIAGLPTEVSAHDPHAALDGGEDGLDAYRRLMPAIARLLAEDGVGAVEIGWGQAAAVSALAREAGLAPRAAARDLAGIERCVTMARNVARSRANA